MKPEDVRHVEVGMKTEPFEGVTANLTVYNTDIKDFQAQVVNAGVGVLRGYLANAEKVRVRGVEFDGTARVNDHLSFFGAAAFTDGNYVSFPDAPPPLEETGGPQVKDISGSSAAGHFQMGRVVWRRIRRAGASSGQAGRVLRGARCELPFVVLVERQRVEVSRGRWLRPLNARVGFRWADGWSLSVWSRNLLDRNYFELLTAAPGNSGLYVGQPGDARTVGVTLRMSLRSSTN